VSVDFDQLELVDLSRHFGRRRALSHISLTCRAGEVVGLLGPTGSGKSTLLGIVSTLVAPSSGEVRYGGRTSRQLGAALRARVGVLAHDLHLYPELTAAENLTFFAELYALDRVAARVEAALGRAGLSDRAGDYVSDFSRGMRQRLALERALLHDPRLLLLDEPFTGLDDASGRTLIERLQALKSAGCIVLLATHDLDLVEDVLDRAVVLRQGRLRELDGTADTLRECYRATLHADAGEQPPAAGSGS
jgi:ABC-type multidrug transport system ATPase subunit